MKKIFFAIIGLAFLCASCEENELPQLDQNPYRMIVGYLPDSYDMEVSGTLTPDEDYDWITVQQIGDAATFTLRRNTTGRIRRAEFSMSGSSYKAIINQEEHSLEVSNTAEFLGQSGDKATISCMVSSNCQDDYSGKWGVIYSKTTSYEGGTEVAVAGDVNFGYNETTISGLQDGVDYYAWTYVESTEGDKVYSNMVAILPPVLVRAGEDLQAAIDGAKQYATIKVQGGAEFMAPKGGIQMGGNNINKTVTGGWDADFLTQSMDNLTVLNGGGTTRGFNCANSDDTPLKGYAKVSYFEIINCNADHGAAIHAVGGPVTINNCYVHDNEFSEKGAIGTNEGSYATEITIYNCIIANNRANGHGAALGFGEGKSNDEPVKATVVSNLIIDNVSTKKDGYASTFICYNQTELIFVNNTVVGNKNWAEYGGPYAGTMFRGDVRSIIANNIFIGNMTSVCTKEMAEPEYERQDGHLNLSGGAGTLINNVYEGAWRDVANATVSGTIELPLGGDLKTFLSDPENGDYYPVGAAANGGTLSKVAYKGNPDSSNKTLDIKGLLEQYSKDLAGNPRTAGGSVACGCYQPK